MCLEKVKMLEKMKQIFELQSKFNQIKQKLIKATIQVSSNDGKIKIIINGEQKLLDIQIDDKILSSGNNP